MKAIKKHLTDLMPKNIFWRGALVLAMIVMLGAGLRLYHLGKNPLIADEFLDMNASYGYFKTNVWQAWDFNKDAVNTTDAYAARDERAWIFKWQVTQFFRVFRPPKLWPGPSAFSGV